MSSYEQTLDSARFTLEDDLDDGSNHPVTNSTPRQMTGTSQSKENLVTFMSDYEETIITLEKEISRYKSELLDLKSQVLNLIEDNQRLSNELKASVETRIHMANESLLNPEIDALKKEVFSLTEAKESILKMWNIALQEIERLEKELERHRMGTDLNMLEMKIKEVKNDYERAVETLSSEINSLKEELTMAKGKAHALQKDLSDIKELNSELETKLQEKEEEVEQSKKKSLEYQSRTFELESKLIDSEKVTESWKTSFKDLENINETLQQQIKALQLREMELESGASEAVQQAKDSMKLAEDAILEKDVAVFREKQAKKEIEGLQMAIDRVVENASDKTKAVIVNVKKKFDEKIKALEDEIKSLEVEVGDKLAQIDRISREKKQLESELNSLYKEKKGAANQALLDDLYLKLTSTEIARDQALSSLQNLESSLKQSKESFQEELQYRQTEIKQLQDQLAAVQQSYKSSANERLELLSKVTKLKNRCLAQEEENSAFRNKLKKDITYFERTLREQQEEHHRHIEDRCQMHNDTIFELKGLVDAQQKIVQKWKEEAKRITEKFERELTKMSSEMIPLKEERKRLKRDLEETENRLAQFEEQNHGLTLENMRLSNKVQLLEQLSKVTSRNFDSS